MPVKKKHRVKTGKTKGASSPFIVFLRRFYKPLAAVLGAVVFFVAYNTYIVDRSMLDIQFALQQTAKAETLDDVQGLNMLLGMMVAKEVSAREIKSENIINLDFANKVASEADMLAEVKDAKFMLSELLNRKKKQRNRLLVVLDTINEKVIKTGDQIRSALAARPAEELVRVEPDEKLISRAAELEKEGDLEEALKIYEEALSQVPQYQGAEKVKMAFLFQRFGNFGRAKIIYDEVIKKSPGSDAAQLARRLLDNLKDMVSLSRKRDLLQEEILREVSADRLQELYYELGSAESMLEDYPVAEEAYKKAAQLGPKTELGRKARFNLGFNYKMQSRYEDSERVFKQLAEDFPQSDLASDAGYWTADSLNNQGRHEEAIEKFQEVAERFKDKAVSPIALFRSGHICLYKLKDPNRAKAYFEKLKNQHGESGITDYVISEIISDLGSVYRDAAFKLVLQGRLEEAMLKFNDAIKLNPQDGRSYSGLAGAKVLMRQLEEAMEKARKGLTLAPQDSYTNAALGLVYISLNNQDAALEQYKKAVAINPSYADAQYNLGWLYQNQGQYDKAITAYRNAVKYDPKMAMAHNNLGVCYWRLERFDGALSEFTLAAKLDKKLAEAHYNLATVHFMFGRLKQAEAELTRTLELTDAIPEAQALLGAVRQKMQEDHSR